MLPKKQGSPNVSSMDCCTSRDQTENNRIAIGMLLRLRLVLLSLGSGVVLLTLLCLGAQNLDDRHQLQLGTMRSVALPSGFLIGVSLVIGVISAGSSAAVLMPNQDD